MAQMSEPGVYLSVSPARPEITSYVTRGALRLVLALGWAPLIEVGLPNGRRADVMALSSKGEIVIVLEGFNAVKSDKNEDGEDE